jgi:prefoldin subunit 5
VKKEKKRMEYEYNNKIDDIKGQTVSMEQDIDERDEKIRQLRKENQELKEDVERLGTLANGV